MSDFDTLAWAAAQRALALQQLQADTQTIATEYKDLFKDDQIRTLAHLNVEQIRQQDAAAGRQRPQVEIYREAGDRVLGALGKHRDAPPASPAASRDLGPTAADWRAEAVQHMRKSRGQFSDV